MVEGPRIAELTDGQNVEATYLVLSCDLKATKNGASYLALTLGDRTGRLPGRVWDRAEELASICPKGSVVRFTGRISSYQGALQIVAASAAPAPEADPADYLEAAERPGEEMLAELVELAETLAEPFRALCLSLLTDPVLAPLIVICPAAKAMHHDYVSGLVEHTLSMARLAELVAGHYPSLNRDLLLTGAIIHDIGKTKELTLTPAPDYTDSGRLLGHIVQGIELVRAHMADDFPPGLADEIIHLVAAHHGQMEFGSPQPPKTMEAVALNMIDDLDAKLNAIGALLDKAEGDWTGYHRLLERHFYQGSADRPALEPTVAPAPEKPKSAKAKPAKPKDDDAPGLFS